MGKGHLETFLSYFLSIKNNPGQYTVHTYTLFDTALYLSHSKSSSREVFKATHHPIWLIHPCTHKMLNKSDENVAQDWRIKMA